VVIFTYTVLTQKRVRQKRGRKIIMGLENKKSEKGVWEKGERKVKV
jgi:hypothetical protein